MWKADLDADEAIRCLLNTGAWQDQRLLSSFWLRVLQRIETAIDLCGWLAITHASGPTPKDSVAPPPSAAPEIVLAWLLIVAHRRMPWLQGRFDSRTDFVG